MKNYNILALCLMLVASVLAGACGSEDKEHLRATNKGGENAAHSEVGSHGGHVLELGSVAHLEYVHDAVAGSVTMHLTGPDLRAPATPDQAPELKLVTDSGPLVLTLRGNVGATSSSFSVTHDALKTEHPTGRISIKIAGTVFSPDLEETHGH